MTIESVPSTSEKYFLISFDKHGNERSDDPDSPDGRLSSVVKEQLATGSITDVFVMSHGWKGDVPAAKQQYDAWSAAMAQCAADQEKIKSLNPNFKPLILAFHWPSLPWGDEDQASEVSFGAVSPSADPLEAMIAEAADKIADTPRAVEALRTIFAAAQDDIEPANLPAEVSDAYQVLFEEADLGAGGPGGAPGADGEAFDPGFLYQEARADEAVSFGLGGALGGLLSPLRQLSFWKMKARAKTVGEGGIGALLRELQEITSGEPKTRFHLMGHSFGCIVVSAAVAGAGGDAPLPRPVESLFLVQGALSLWSYCSEIPVAAGTTGYFNSIVDQGKVAGVTVTTQSMHDTAVGKLYPLAAGVSSQIEFAPGELPKYGSVGTFGLRGPGMSINDLDIGPLGHRYEFEPGQVYNIDGSETISEGGGMSGAHSDIAKPEVGHIFWEALLALK